MSMGAVDHGSVLKISLPSSHFRCSEKNCDMSFDTQSLLEQHHRMHSRKQLKRTHLESLELFSSNDVFLDHPGEYAEAFCGSNQINCLESGAGQQDCVTRNDRLLPKILTAMIVHPSKREYKCTFSSCGKTYPSPYKLQEHLRSHSGERPFSCDHCGACFASKMSWSRHKLVHKDVRAYKCTFPSCGKQFRRADGLRDHEKVHSGDKLHICSFGDCQRRFASASTLKIHMQRHAGVRPYQCSHVGCGKSYLTLANLKSHSKKHTEPIAKSLSFSTAKELLSNTLSLNDHFVHSYALPEVFSPQSFFNLPEDSAASKCRNIGYSVENHMDTSNCKGVDGGCDCNCNCKDVECTCSILSLASDRKGFSSLLVPECISGADSGGKGMNSKEHSKFHLVDVLTSGIDMSEITAAALGEVACVQYITSSIAESLSLLQENEISVTDCQHMPLLRGNIEADLADVDSTTGQEVELEVHVNGYYSSSPLASSRDLNMKDVGMGESHVCGDSMFCTEPSMELSTGHLEIDCSFIPHSALLTDHVYLHEDIQPCRHHGNAKDATGNVEDVREV